MASSLLNVFRIGNSLLSWQFIVLIILVPLPIFFSHYVYTTSGLTGWVAVGIAWTFCSAITVVLYPLYESRHAILLIAKGVLKVSILPSSLVCFES